MWNALAGKISSGDKRSLSRAISLVENEVGDYEKWLRDLPPGNSTRVTGITGPAGAGKSTIVSGLIKHYVHQHCKVAVICIDPTSSFTGGALLGDRVRMSEWYDHPDVFIRSMATRGSYGGLNPAIIEVTDLIKAAGFDQVIIETVGVGQTEIEIAALADTTVVVQVPEGGDDIQAMKAGLMEVANIFAVNKCDRPGADLFINNLNGFLHEQQTHIPIVKLVATDNTGIGNLAEKIADHQQQINRDASERISLLVKKASQLLLKKKMKSVDQEKLIEKITAGYLGSEFNLYKLIDQF